MWCQGIDVAPPVAVGGGYVGGGLVVLPVVPVLAPVSVRVLVVRVPAGAPPGPVDRPSSAPEVSVPPGDVELGVGGRDGDWAGSRSDGTGDG
ncbi:MULTISPECIES: hypothetical protein [Streptomyces]|uniref:hypothetical protein n=1 Tax=Streptomyces TaxID=1883 RepID=UPI0002FA7647|nr:hypothetical protein [Streptomyces griseus]